ncbi:lytic transglycosylase domain-containing protein [Thermodesulfobacteriota bacterium]
MSQILIKSKFILIPLFFGLQLLIHLCLIHSTIAAHPLLKKNIIAYNLKALERSLADDSYRGEEGLLRIRPETASSLGMKVFIDKDYLDSKRLFKEAENSLKNAKIAMASSKKQQFPGYYVKKITDYFLFYKTNSEAAKRKLMSYRSRLGPDLDERLNKNIGSRLIGKILEKSLIMTNNRLRDGLGYFFNICQGVNEKKFPLTPENVLFVNHVFNGFLEQANEKDIKIFNIDQDSGYKSEQLSYNWKEIAGKEISQFGALLEAIFKKTGNKIYAVDPLLFIALLRKESAFDPLAISHMGAAGLTQIMPETAKDLGMKKIHMPAYFHEAVSLIRQERKIKSRAMEALFKIGRKNGTQHAKQARELMQKSLNLGKKRRQLFDRYKKELLEKRTDERLQPAKAIEYGLKYFAGLMKNQKGDISLALASYNAGPHRIREFKGIPPYVETVGFRNRILQYYRDYLSKAEGK